MSEWTEAEDAALKLHIGAGLSASAIAAEIGNGRSRSAIIGRAHRAGLSIGGGKPEPRSAAKIPIRKPAKPSVEFSRVRPGQRTPTASEAIAHAEYQAKAQAASDAPQPGPVPIIEVMGKFGRCKFYLPDHEGLHGLVCGEHAASEMSYCARHHKLSRTPLKARAG